MKPCAAALVLIAIYALGVESCSLLPLDTSPPRIEVHPDGKFTGEQMRPADAEHLLVQQVTKIAPVLFPAHLSGGMGTCVANGDRGSFLVSCFGGAQIFSLQTQTRQKDPASYNPKVLRRLTFRGDDGAQFMDLNPGDAGATKLVVWSEPGHSSAPACSCVLYDLHALGVTETEFWTIANSLAVATGR